MHARKSLLIALLTLLLAGPPAFATTVGLASDSVNPIYAEQKKSEWCWAACIEMIANLYGADLSQDEVVARSYGPGVNHAGSLEVITSNLNGGGTTRHGRTYQITSKMLTNRLLPAALVAELTAGHPVMLGCDAGGSGHAVVCTAVSYDGPASDPTITALTVRDPWPSNENRRDTGRRVVSGTDFGPHIMEGWVIHIVVHEAGGEVVPAPQGYTFNDTNKVPNPTTREYAFNDANPAPGTTASAFADAARDSTRRFAQPRTPSPRPAWRPDDDADDDTAERVPPRRPSSDFEHLVNGCLTLLAPP